MRKIEQVSLFTSQRGSVKSGIKSGIRSKQEHMSISIESASSFSRDGPDINVDADSSNAQSKAQTA